MHQNLRGLSSCRINGPLLGLILSSLSLVLSSQLTRADVQIDNNSRHATEFRQVYSKMPDVWKSSIPVRVRAVSASKMNWIIEEALGHSDDRSDGSIVDGCFQNGDSEASNKTSESADDATTMKSEKSIARISILETLSDEQASLVFAHEYGHYVWTNLLSVSQHNAFTRIWNEQKKAHRLISRYAGESEEEGFGEAFSYFLLKPGKLAQKDRLSADFLQNLIDTKLADVNPASVDDNG